MGKLNITVKTVVAVGIGAALVFVLKRFVAIPTGVPNTNLDLGIAVLSFFAAVFGPIAGLLIGFIGHFLTDLTFGWGVWWTWVVGSALFGFAVGFMSKLYKIEDGQFGVKQCLIFNSVQIAANLVIWAVIAPTLDILIYQEPANKVYLQGVVIAAVNIIVVLIIGSLLAFGYSKTRTKAGSLKSE